MIEFFLCSLLTIFPDYLYRRYVQGKRIGREINIFSMWYELRWGLVSCLILTLSLITTIFYFHPATTNVTALFRTVTILPDRNGRVAEVYVGLNDRVEKDQPLFRLDTTEQEAAVATAQRQVTQVDADARVTETQLANSDAKIAQAEAAFQQAKDEYDTRAELAKNPETTTISRREVERSRVAMVGAQAAVDSANADKYSLQTKLNTLLPAQRATAVAQLKQAQVDIDKSTVRAGVSGTVQQFTLRAGDVVNPMIRTAGFLIPESAGRIALVAGFNQIEAGVLQPGMIAEATCSSAPWVIIPMVVTQVQNVIASGQVRQGENLVDLQQVNDGTITTYLEPLYKGGLDAVPPGASCTANAYSSSYDELHGGHDVGTLQFLFLHAIDATALVHAMIIRVQALLAPIQILVLTGGH